MSCDPGPEPIASLLAKGSCRSPRVHHAQTGVRERDLDLDAIRALGASAVVSTGRAKLLGAIEGEQIIEQKAYGPHQSSEAK